VNVYESRLGDDLEQKKEEKLHSQTYSGSEVSYDSTLGTPHVFVDKENFHSSTDYLWVEATFKSPTYGEFSAVSDSVAAESF
jgi:hypothetical protein